MSKDNQSISDSSLNSEIQTSAKPLSPPHQKTADNIHVVRYEASDEALKQDQEGRWKLAEETHQYVREHIRLADQKATFFFAGSTALLAYLYNHGLTNRWFIQLTTWGFADMLSFLATVCLILSALACIMTIMPRLKGSMRGLIFFAAICEYDNSQAYVNEVMRQNLTELCEAKLKHTYELSKVCTKKYDILRWGQWLGSAGFIAALFLFIFLK